MDASVLWFMIIVSIGLVTMGLALQGSQSRIERRLANIEVELAEMRIQLGLLEKPPTEDERIQALARAGLKLDAIKLYREHYGVGLREAKEAVDGIVARMGLR